MRILIIGFIAVISSAACTDDYASICRDVNNVKNKEILGVIPEKIAVHACLTEYSIDFDAEFALSELDYKIGDINEDGLDDYFLYYSSLYCGSGGCGGEFYIKTENGYCHLDTDSHMGTKIDALRERFKEQIQLHECKNVE